MAQLKGVTSIHSLRMRGSVREKGFQAERTVDTFYRLRTP